MSTAMNGRMIINTGAAALALLLWEAPAAWGASDAAAAWKTACQAFENPAVPSVGGDVAFLMGQCAGTTKTLLRLGTALPTKIRFCRPQKIAVRDGINVALEFMDKHPNRANEEYWAVALEAFREKWPCPKRTRSGKKKRESPH